MNRPALAALLLALTPSLLGCMTEERVIAVRGGLYGVPGAQSNRGLSAQPVSAGVTVQDIVERHHGGNEQLEIGEEVEGWPNRRRLEDGSLYLISRAPRELVIHLFETTIDGDWELMFDQLIANEAKDNYSQANRDPQDIIKFLREHRVDFVTLLRHLNFGEHSPGVEFIALPGNLYRLEVPLAREARQRFSTMEMVLEDGRMKLLLIR
jgi:hypothetical protein